MPRFCKQCLQDAELKILPETKRIEITRNKRGEVVTLRSVADFIPDPSGLCFLHRKVKMGLIQQKEFK